MFEDTIVVRRGSNVYQAAQIPLRKEISDTNNSYHIKIQTYVLTQKIDEFTVFVLQLKYIPMNDITNNQHPSTFFDQIWFEHKSRALLESTINLLFRAFDCDGFIQYNKHKNQFEFKFQSKQTVATISKSVSLLRKQYTKNEATVLLTERFKTIQPRNITVLCINGYDIIDVNWDFEVNLTLLPGKYKCYLNELVGSSPMHIHVRDYSSIRNIYEEKLKNSIVMSKILYNYLNYLGIIDSTTKMMEWSKYGLEIAPLLNLCSILCIINKTHDIWLNLFEICSMDEVDNTIIRNVIPEQTVADFIVLSLIYYVQNSRQHRSTKMLLESERYILSFVSSYLQCEISITMDKSSKNELLMSGLFNHVCKSLTINAMEGCMNVEPFELKQKLLESLHFENCDIIKQYYVAVLHQISSAEPANPTQWTFYVRLLTHSEIHSTQIVYGYFKKYVENQVPNDIILLIFRFFCGRTKQINIHAENYTDYFEFKERNVPGMSFLNLVIKCVDLSFEYDWALWIKKRLRLYSASLGYWKILEPLYDLTADQFPPSLRRVPVEHLDCMLSLLRHNSMNITSEIFTNENYSINIVFLQNEKLNINNYNSWTKRNVEAEYKLTFWNAAAFGNSALSLRLLKASDPIVDKKTRLKMRDSHFIYYKSRKNIEWRWYDNDPCKYKEYNLGPSVPKQLEASYQGVCEQMFPLERFNRASALTERSFNCAQLPNMSKALVDKHIREKWIPFVLRFTFHTNRNKIVNIEQLAAQSYYDQWPRRVRRWVMDHETRPVAIDEEELTISSIGKMNIHTDQSEQSIIIYWEFEANSRLNIMQKFYFKTEIPNSQQKLFKRILDMWRTNSIFDLKWNQNSNSRSVVLWKSNIDDNMPPIIDMIPLFIISGYIRKCNIDQNVSNDVINLLLYFYS